MVQAHTHARTHAHIFFKRVIAFLLISVFFGCENDIDSSLKEDSFSQFKIINGILAIDSNAELIEIHNRYKNNSSFQDSFNQMISKLQSQGFRPLEPIFNNDDPQMVEDFVKRKILRLKKRDLDYGINTAIYSRSDSETQEVDLDDELIRDTFLTSILNEEREIYIGNKLYKYTELGLLICGDDSKNLQENKILLDNYLESLTPVQRVSIINQKLQSADPCDTGIRHLEAGIDIFQDISPCDYSTGSNTSTSNSTIPANVNIPQSELIKQNLPICDAVANTLWELVFGVSDGCITDMGDNKRVKTKFWNQNYYIFSSIGCKVKFQKHITHWYASWWEKSYAEKLELGVNYVTYDYVFNVPAFNMDQYNYETKFFEFNGTKYNSNGQVINTVPTGAGTFVFDTQSSQSIMNITLFNHHITNSEINQVIDLAVMQCVNGIQNWMVRSEIINKINTGQIKYNVINAVPFDDKVKMITKSVKWTSNNENSIVHYFDMNFLFTWKSSYNDFGDYLQGLNGATEYKNVSADIYGAAYNSGQWGGSRIKFNAE